MPSHSDVLVVGGGPAGCAAAIAAARAGARVTMLERHAAPRAQPGETLHPGIASLFRRLDAEDVLRTATSMRHAGHWVRTGDYRRFVPFGQDANGPWRGFQIRRNVLESRLREHAVNAGVEIHLGVRVTDVIRTATGRVTGVATVERESLLGSVVVDAAGPRHGSPGDSGSACSGYHPDMWRALAMP